MNLDPIFKDPYLEEIASLADCVKEFVRKGGSLQVLSKNKDGTLQEDKMLIKPHDALYPICSGAQCRSQVLHTLLKKVPFPVTLFPPHAARYGHDPYNNRVNLDKRKPCEDDNAYIEAFGHPKSDFFGNSFCCHFDAAGHFKERLNFFNDHFYGPNSHHEGKKGNRRTYIAFAEPVHATIKRLNETNACLKNVFVIAVPLIDEITHPPENKNFNKRSKEAYMAFADKLKPTLPLTSDLDAIKS